MSGRDEHWKLFQSRAASADRYSLADGLSVTHGKITVESKVAHQRLHEKL
jgi:hypothetical protein